LSIQQELSNPHVVTSLGYYPVQPHPGSLLLVGINKIYLSSQDVTFIIAFDHHLLHVGAIGEDVAVGKFRELAY
jgi:hypothetical protein